MSYNRGAVLTRLRVLSLRLCRLEVISVAGPGVLKFAGVHVTLFRKCLAGSMLESVGIPQEYVYSMSLSHLEQILV